ncbi:MAG: hypothetical protein IKI15_07335 [Lachnospiraceae bacterium]|nr:hypothetical protein [Lachnospiraceae bacterium]
MFSKKEPKKQKKVSLPVRIFRLILKAVRAVVKLFLLILKVLPFASMCADRFGKKESTS